MNSADIIAYHFDGAVYCPDCTDNEDMQDNEECSPVFADSLEDEIGATCDSCRNCLSDNGEWISGEDITDKRFYRWSECTYCGEQRPHEINGYSYRDNSLLALQKRLVCRNCRKPEVHF